MGSRTIMQNGCPASGKWLSHSCLHKPWYAVGQLLKAGLSFSYGSLHPLTYEFTHYSVNPWSTMVSKEMTTSVILWSLQGHRATIDKPFGISDWH